MRLGLPLALWLAIAAAIPATNTAEDVFAWDLTAGALHEFDVRGCGERVSGEGILIGAGQGNFEILSPWIPYGGGWNPIGTVWFDVVVSTASSIEALPVSVEVTWEELDEDDGWRAAPPRPMSSRHWFLPHPRERTRAFCASVYPTRIRAGMLEGALSHWRRIEGGATFASWVREHRPELLAPALPHAGRMRFRLIGEGGSEPSTVVWLRLMTGWNCHGDR